MGSILVDIKRLKELSGLNESYSQVVSEEENVSVETIVDALNDLDHMIQTNGNAIGLDDRTIYKYHTMLTNIAEELEDELRESEVSDDHDQSNY
jgi:hypothetical protein